MISFLGTQVAVEVEDPNLYGFRHSYPSLIQSVKPTHWNVHFAVPRPPLQLQLLVCLFEMLSRASCVPAHIHISTRNLQQKEKETLERLRPATLDSAEKIIDTLVLTDTMLTRELPVALRSQLITLIARATDPPSNGTRSGAVHLLTVSVNPAVGVCVYTVWVMTSLY